MSALLRKDLFRVPMRPISGTDEDRLRHRWGTISPPTNRKHRKIINRGL